MRTDEIAIRVTITEAFEPYTDDLLHLQIAVRCVERETGEPVVAQDSHLHVSAPTGQSSVSSDTYAAHPRPIALFRQVTFSPTEHDLDFPIGLVKDFAGAIANRNGGGVVSFGERYWSWGNGGMVHIGDLVSVGTSSASSLTDTCDSCRNWRVPTRT